MKKFYNAVFIVILVGFLIFIGLIINDSRPFMKSYFEVQRQKLNLRSEKSVDSLQNCIIISNTKIDSLTIINNHLKNENQDLKKTNNDETIMLKNLQKALIDKD